MLIHMWKPKLKTWADKFFWAVVGLASISCISLIARIAWVITGINIERWAESQGIDDTLAEAWPQLMAWFVENSVWLSVSTSFLIGAALALFIYRRLVPMDRLNLRQPEEIRKIGSASALLAQDMLRFLERRAIENTHRREEERKSAKKSGMRDTWEADRDFESVTSSQFFSQFGPQTLRILAVLDQSGIKLPHHILSMGRYARPEGIVQVLAVFGEYLKNGELEEAIALSHDRNFMWQIQH
ncbi:hypothetical protein A8B82_05635 [Sulfitobacter sp. EhC04]|uniref:hypothetical protein n=1 Tax=Sulfitobacter sp. EhC04 TaxID=1849168 RepID=UPI0007F522E1|nr:hypothetical protein [Sulfitobacter sp. EhC04]OAN67700.1 hypothetical protein A8B82_05635 [Sulfitobacter sp. EhC04]